MKVCCVAPEDRIESELSGIAAKMVGEGLFVGPQSAANLAAAVKIPKQLGPGHVICTVISD